MPRYQEALEGVELLKEWLLRGAAALMNARTVLTPDLLGKTQSSCPSWKLLNLLGNVGHSMGCPRSPPQHPLQELAPDKQHH